MCLYAMGCTDVPLFHSIQDLYYSRVIRLSSINCSLFLSLTALKQALAAYFQEESIGDVGGKKAKYIPKRGHPGTLVSTMLCYISKIVGRIVG